MNRNVLVVTHCITNTTSPNCSFCSRGNTSEYTFTFCQCYFNFQPLYSNYQYPADCETYILAWHIRQKTNRNMHLPFYFLYEYPWICQYNGLLCAATRTLSASIHTTMFSPEYMRCVQLALSLYLRKVYYGRVQKHTHTHTIQRILDYTSSEEIHNNSRICTGGSDLITQTKCMLHTHIWDKRRCRTAPTLENPFILPASYLAQYVPCNYIRKRSEQPEFGEPVCLYCTHIIV